MRFFRHTYIVLLSFLLTCSNLFGQVSSKVYTVADVPNVQLKDSTRFVSDVAHSLSLEERKSLDKTLLSIRQAYNVDFAIVLLPSIGEEPIENFSYELFRKWGLGQKGKDTGLLLVVVPQQKKVRFETGYGLEGILPDALLGQVIRNDFAPNFRQGNIALGLYLGIGHIAQRLEANKEELLSSRQLRPHQQKRSKQRIPSSSILFFYSLFLAIVYISLIYGLQKAKHSVKNSRQARQKLISLDSELLKGRLGAIVLYIPLLLLIFSENALSNGLILLLIFLPYYGILYFFGLSYQRFIKKRAYHCPNCGQQGSMQVHKQTSALLSDKQRLEAKLGAKTFVAYHCSHCAYDEIGAETIAPPKYSVCPQCQTQAVALINRKAINYQGLRYIRSEYKCLYCGDAYHKDKRDNSPDNRDLAEGLLLGALLGGLGGGRRGGGFSGGGAGGFSGGSWGGGMSGGGGATGSW